MKMIRTTLGDSIKEVEVIRETGKQIVYLHNGKERRELKKSQWYSFHKTKEEAISHLIAMKEQKIAFKLREIERCKDEIEKIKLL